MGTIPSQTHMMLMQLSACTPRSVRRVLWASKEAGSHAWPKGCHALYAALARTRGTVRRGGTLLDEPQKDDAHKDDLHHTSW